jgi:predicted amidohydrolase
MITRSIENRVFTITANRIGEERGWRFTGESQITTPDGKILARAGKKQEIVRVIAINPKEARNKKITPLNDLFGDR